MSKKKLPRRPPKGTKAPSGLKGFDFTNRKGVQAHPTSHDDQTDTPSTEFEVYSVYNQDEVLCREAPANDAERKKLIQCLLDKFHSCENVADSDIRWAIGASAWKDLKAELKQLSRPVPRYIVSILKPYIAELERADFLYARAESSRSNHCSGSSYVGLHPKRTLACQAENAYDRAHELLEQLVESYPEILMWLDRPVKFGQVNGTLSPDPEGVPRLITSRSQYAYTLKDKRRLLKIRTLKYYLANLDRPRDTGRRIGSGIGDAPVVKGQVDQWIFDGKEYRLI
ncbi:MAG: hypothetical protein NTV11_00810 [Rhodocyclales bacterium]|nr:hypothetical protein [Rhodocyclales bacterium]